MFYSQYKTRQHSESSGDAEIIIRKTHDSSQKHTYTLKHREELAVGEARKTLLLLMLLVFLLFLTLLGTRRMREHHTQAGMRRLDEHTQFTGGRHFVDDVTDVSQ